MDHCPTQAQIDYNKGRAQETFKGIKDRIREFMLSGEETTAFLETEFESTWVFALVMGLCGEYYFDIPTIVISYGRSDGLETKASIQVTNAAVKVCRLLNELETLSEKMKNMSRDSSKYEKALEKRNRLQNEIEKLKQRFPF